MEPKEKAEELVDKYIAFVDSVESKYTTKELTEYAKQCALIAVEEIKKSFAPTSKVIGEHFVKYWEQVEEEIKKLGTNAQ